MNNDKTKSRKWNLILLVFWAATFLVLAPPLISVWVFGATTPLVIISGTEFVSLITLLVSAYYGANIAQRHVELKNGVDATKTEDVTEKSDDEGKEA